MDRSVYSVIAFTNMKHKGSNIINNCIHNNEYDILIDEEIFINVVKFVMMSS